MPAAAISAPVDANCQAPRWSPDGSQLLYEANDHTKKTVHLYAFTPASRSTRRVVIPGVSAGSSMTAGFSTATSQHVSHEASFAPVGNRFVYSASGSSGDYDLYLDTGARLSPMPGTDGNPAWSPDGRYIAFTSSRTGQGDIYLLEVATLDAPPRRLTADPTASEIYAAWSPDSTSLAFVGHAPRGDNLYLIDNLLFPAPRAITAWARVQTRPTFSPDGKRIAFYSDHTAADRFDLYVMPVGGTPTLVAADVVMNARGPTWTPDGGSLIYVQHDPDRFDPVRQAPWADPTRVTTILTGTVGNGDLDVVKRGDGTVWLAVTARGAADAERSQRDFMKVYVMGLP
ncbi:MAG: hypothetical protein EXR69_16210 [Myxococcales bacterium]|nr:hypothetical protein [Myxococcales bacterium]